MLSLMVGEFLETGVFVQFRFALRWLMPFGAVSFLGGELHWNWCFRSVSFCFVMLQAV